MSCPPAPDLLEELVPRRDTTGVEREGVEKAKLGGRQPGVFAVLILNDTAILPT